MQLEPWTEALRSGDYPQTAGTLHDSSGFCCLGVAAVVYGIATPEQMVCDDTSEGPSWVYEELADRIPENIISRGIEMNDSGRSFTEIAEMINGTA